MVLSPSRDHAAILVYLVADRVVELMICFDFLSDNNDVPFVICNWLALIVNGFCNRYVEVNEEFVVVEINPLF